MSSIDNSDRKLITLVKTDSTTRLGISFSSVDGQVKVSGIAPKSLASKTDLREGDKVVTINGKSVSGMDSKNTAALLRSVSGPIEIIAESEQEEEEATKLNDVEEANSSSFLLAMEKNTTSSTLFEEQESFASFASTMSRALGLVISTLQVLVTIVLLFKFQYGNVEEYSTQKYIVFRDIMVMLLLGFGYLMTFLEKYGLGAVGFTMLLTALNMECNLIIESFLTSNFSITMDSIINAEFSAATLLISFGALIGRTTPLQMCLIAIAESAFYAINKILIVFGMFQAEDVGGTLTIHMFGAFFGLAASYALGPQEKESASNNTASRVSDVFSLVGTTLLWVYWPSFVGATETGVDENEMHCLINTIMSLLGSTGAAFYVTQYLNKGKFDAVHIQNSTLAGGVAIGATARLAMGPSAALMVGLVAGSVSVLGYYYSSPFLEEKLGLYDTCGVANLHGYPSVVGGLLSILLVCFDYKADFLVYGLGIQSIVQVLAVLATIVAASLSGYLTGSIVLRNPLSFADVPDYEDAVWWSGEF